MVLSSLRQLVRRLAGPSRQGRSTEARPSFRPELLRLEDRFAPAVVLWNGGPHGLGTDWNDPSNWVGNHLPGHTDDAVIDASFSGSTITSAHAVTIHSITSNASLQIIGGTFFVASDSVIAGDVSVGGATLSLAGILTITGGFTQTHGGTTQLADGTLDVNLADIQGGLLTGSGLLTGDVQNAGTITPGSMDPAHLTTGSLSILGNYTQTASGTLNLEIGETSTDFLYIAGTANFDGTLNISLVGHFVPQAGDVFVPMNFGAHSGDFATVNGLTIDHHLAFDLVADDNNLYLFANEV